MAERGPDRRSAPPGPDGADVVGQPAETTHAYARAARRSGARDLFAAIDLGTNNCRLLVAEPSARGFRVVDSFSRIVRLGEGLARTGSLSEAAQARAIEALGICADKLRRRGVPEVRCITTQACRVAANGAEFLRRTRAETGLSFEVITPKEEARYCVLGCVDLIDPKADAALVIDIGGGSTEMSWVDAVAARAARRGDIGHALLAWTSIPLGVVTLAESCAEGDGQAEAYADMLETARDAISACRGAPDLSDQFAAGRAHMIGASGTVTSLASVHLGLSRYDRSAVDGLWFDVAAARSTGARLAAMTPQERARQPCIGLDRSDLVVAGAAILEAVFERWPSQRMRVADRGLREGLLLHMMASRRRARDGVR
jgi:exopolyphosphatase/guanosine-5'-triphosphate,3'-diphosphate pyrophosphatase